MKLNVSQDTLWCKAEKADWANMGSVQGGLHAQHEEMSALLAQPCADLHAVARRLDAFQTEGQKRCAANRERWLGVYDALDSKQKEPVRIFFRDKMEQANQADVTQSLK